MEKNLWPDKTKISSGAVKYFASFSSKGVGDLYFYEDKLDSKAMKRIINTNIVPSARRLFGQHEWFLLHDNDNGFRSNETIAHFRKKKIKSSSSLMKSGLRTRPT